MNRKDLYSGFNEVDDDILERSETASRSKRKPMWLKWGAIAACLCLVIGEFVAPNLNEEPGTENNQSQDFTETVIYNGSEFVVCGTGEVNILEECGLPTAITKDLAGEHLGYLKKSEKNTYCVADELENSGIELFEYAPEPNDNVYILCIDGEYYAAIRRNSEGYHGLTGKE